MKHSNRKEYKQKKQAENASKRSQHLHKIGPTSTPNRPLRQGLGRFLGRLDTSWNDLGAILGFRDALGGVLGASWGDLGAPRTPVEASWGRPGVIFGGPGRPWRRLGGVLGRFWGSPDARRGVLGRPGVIFRAPGRPWRRPGGVLGRPGAVLKRPGTILDRLGTSWGDFERILDALDTPGTPENSGFPEGFH